MLLLRILFGYTQYTFYRSNIYMLLLRILFGYTQYTFYGSSSALVFYLLAWKLKRNNHMSQLNQGSLLWPEVFGSKEINVGTYWTQKEFIRTWPDHSHESLWSQWRIPFYIVYLKDLYYILIITVLFLQRLQRPAVVGHHRQHRDVPLLQDRGR